MNEYRVKTSCDCYGYDRIHKIVAPDGSPIQLTSGDGTYHFEAVWGNKDVALDLCTALNQARLIRTSDGK